MNDSAENSGNPGEARRKRRPPLEPGMVAGREPPHNTELEKVVLAALLDGRNAIAMQQVRPVMEHPLGFWARDHRIVYLACLELDDAGHRPDIQAVADLLSRYRFPALVDKLKQQQMLLEADQLDALGRTRLREFWKAQEGDLEASYEDSALAAIGGFSALGDLSQATGPIAPLERNALLLKDYYLKRKLIVRLNKVVDDAHRTPDQFNSLLDRSNSAMIELARGLGDKAIHSVDQVADEVINDIQNRIENPQAAIKTGIPDLDKHLMALRPGGLYVLAARPGVGKTSFALKIVTNIVSRVEDSHRALFVSLEVDRKDLLRKMVTAEGDLNFQKLEEGRLDQDEMSRLLETLNRFRSWPLDLLDVTDLTVQGLRSLIKRRKAEDPTLSLIVLDYLQLLSSSKPDANEHEKVSEISRILKTLAMELKVPVVALSQMNRDSEKGAGAVSRPPKLADLRGSGAIEQDADAVIFLHRVDAGDGQKQEGDPDAARKIQVIVAKNRFGPQGVVHMDFHPAKMRFVQSAFPGTEEDGGPVVPAEVLRDRKERMQSTPDDAAEDMF